ncbi:serine--tRNA synthetase-like protein Slimp [Episyrphus balteatus]|uniref:serine--tRNA synthetase-like protein Slimp n=1 Tax=Episyrphus balteatus TaxID=286459 RepID=UPI002486536F|nr:serine--tRNA synthetase-like protein Slimp [Episyrphus balteatus]
MFCLHNFALRNKSKALNLRRYISVLYLTGDKAKENYVPLVPYMDFQKRLDDLSLLKENTKRRGLNVDLESLKTKYEHYLHLQNEKANLEQAREEISKKMKKIDKDSDNQAIDELKTNGIALRNALKTIKESIYPVEEDFIQQFLHLPNELHKKCPQGNEEALIYRNSLPPQDSSPELSHLKRTDLIHYQDRDSYYLLDDAAQFELDCTHLCRDLFVRNDFVSMTNPDFTRKVLMEANLTPSDRYQGVYEEDQRHHLNSAFLTGGGSFESFLGHLAKLFVYPSVLPLRMVSSGRQYNSKEGIPSEMGLYSAIQSNSVQTLVASSSLEEADRQMDEILNLAVDFYKGLGLHFKIVFVKPSALTPSESLRASIQVYSPAYSKYMEVGSVSHYLDFVSQRILFNTKDKKETKFLHLVGGPIVQSSILIAAMIENQVPLSVPQNCKQKTQVEVFKSLFD